MFRSYLSSSPQTTATQQDARMDQSPMASNEDGSVGDSTQKSIEGDEVVIVEGNLTYHNVVPADAGTNEAEADAMPQADFEGSTGGNEDGEDVHFDSDMENILGVGKNGSFTNHAEEDLIDDENLESLETLLKNLNTLVAEVPGDDTKDEDVSPSARDDDMMDGPTIVDGVDDDDDDHAPKHQDQLEQADSLSLHPSDADTEDSNNGTDPPLDLSESKHEVDALIQVGNQMLTPQKQKPSTREDKSPIKLEAQSKKSVLSTWKIVGLCMVLGIGMKLLPSTTVPNQVLQIDEGFKMDEVDTHVQTFQQAITAAENTENTETVLAAAADDDATPCNCSADDEAVHVEEIIASSAEAENVSNAPHFTVNIFGFTEVSPSLLQCNSIPTGICFLLSILSMLATFLVRRVSTTSTPAESPRTPKKEDTDIGPCPFSPSPMSPVAFMEQLDIDVWDLNAYEELKVVELRAMLKARGCCPVGKKELLANRLVQMYISELATMRVKDLRVILKQKGCKQGGKKNEMVQRLVELGL